MNHVVRAVMFFVTIGVIGCGESDPLGRCAVSGKVVLAGQPLESGSISFEPIGKGVAAGATITKGVYSIPAVNGLPPGSYVVRISSPVGGIEAPEVPGESNVLAVEQIPNEFNTNSTLKVDVTKNGKNSFDFNIPQKAK
jgi:hypothetical protein